MLATAVITASGISFRIFVGQNRTLSIKYRFRDNVLGGDEFYFVLLPLNFVKNGVRNLRISFIKILLKKSSNEFGGNVVFNGIMERSQRSDRFAVRGQISRYILTAKRSDF